MAWYPTGVWTVAAAIGCGTSSPPSAPAEPAPVAAPAGVDAGGDAARGGRGAKADGAGRPTPAWIRRVADGDVPRDQVVDGARGVVFASVSTDARGDDPRADAQGVIREAVLACGDDLTKRYDALTADLRGRLADGLAVTCDGAACAFPARMEYDHGGTLGFRRADGRVVLASVVTIEGGATSPAFVADAQAWADGQVRTLTAGSCP